MTTTWNDRPRSGARFSPLAWIGIVFVVAALGSVAWGVSSYNALVSLDQGAQAQWAQVENVYQRRMDLIPNLVNTVSGAAHFERDTLTAVTEARARVGQVTAGAAPSVTADPAAFARYQAAQDALSTSLSRLMVVVERYPELRAVEGFRDLQGQLEGAENRIAVERMRYNEAAQAFNTRRNAFPTVIVASAFGARFREKSYFAARQGADVPPVVRF